MLTLKALTAVMNDSITQSNGPNVRCYHAHQKRARRVENRGIQVLGRPPSYCIGVMGLLGFPRIRSLVGESSKLRADHWDGLSKWRAQALFVEASEYETIHYSVM
eukprot:gb/GECG01014078.1/.p1 GENE.gb/GECG01014078.1/~~gb/GECG01014078.1/.p1  ORF type:complete len:105 (+),score=5.44 gb/GECG01014078.1/:1-315(+)